MLEQPEEYARVVTDLATTMVATTDLGLSPVRGWRRSDGVAPAPALTLGRGGLASAWRRPKGRPARPSSAAAGLPMCPPGSSMPGRSTDGPDRSAAPWAGTRSSARSADRRSLGVRGRGPARCQPGRMVRPRELDVDPDRPDRCGPRGFDRSAARRDGRTSVLDVLVHGDGRGPPRLSGVAFSEPGTYDDLVNVTDGHGRGDSSPVRWPDERRLELPRLEPAARRVGASGSSRLLRSVRSVSWAIEPWDVEWADDGTTCWLVQLRPITAPTVPGRDADRGQPRRDPARRSPPS